VDAIAANPAPATFDNTLVALESSGLLLQRVDTVFSNLNDANTNPAMQQVEREMAPKLSAQRDAILLNTALFARIRALHETRGQAGLDAESLRLLERYYKDFVRAGALLSGSDKIKLKALNSELAVLQTTFSQNVLKETNASAVVVDQRGDLAGMSANEIAATEAAAAADGKDGKFVIRLLNTSGQPALGSLENRSLWQRLQETSVGRGSRGGTGQEGPARCRSRQRIHLEKYLGG